MKKPQTLMRSRRGHSSNNKGIGQRSDKVEALMLLSKCSHLARHLITVETCVRREGEIMAQVANEVRKGKEMTCETRNMKNMRKGY